MTRYIYHRETVGLSDFDEVVNGKTENGFKIAFCFPMMKNSGTTQLNGQPVMEFLYDCIFEKQIFDV